MKKQKILNNKEEIGYIQTDDKTLIPEKDSIFIVHIELYEKYRKSGLFRKVFKKLIETYKSKGFKKIFLEPDITQGKSYTNYLIELYKHFGFIEYDKDETLLVKIL